MAFIFTVETGALVTGANSYISVAEADDYYAVDPNFATTWAAYTSEQKEQRLAWSTRVMDQKCIFYGSPVTETQALRWPRNGACTRDHVAIGRSTIPAQLKHAVMEHLKYAIGNDPTTGSDVERLRGVVVDVIEVMYQEGTSQTSVPNVINHTLDGIGHYMVGSKRFAPITRS